jgi:hypothetical protein
VRGMGCLPRGGGKGCPVRPATLTLRLKVKGR